MTIKYLKLWNGLIKKVFLLLLGNMFLFGGVTNAQVNMNHYITLNVTKDSLISIRLATDAANTPIRIVSGDSVYDFTTTSTSLTTLTSYYAGANTMTIYGDVKDFRCYDNKTKITGIDVSNNTALTYLDCYENQLTSLDVSTCTSLKTLYCDRNQLTSLDVSGCTALTNLQCYSNQLTSLDVSGCSALEYLACYGNQLTSLDVSKNVALEYLYGGSNPLTSLDVSKNTSLYTLSCSNNQLTSLDLSQNVALCTLFCFTNQLTSLDLSKNTALTYLACYGNPFTTAEYDAIMCSLPFVSSGTRSFRPLYNSSDTNATKFAASNSLNAKAKNWNVQYYSGGAAIPATSGNYDCSGINMNRYITLNVTKDSLISIRLATDTANTPIRIVSGDSVYNFINANFAYTKYYAGDSTMTIYGDVKDFRCNNNNTKITGIDVSKNVALCTLYCYGNPFTTEEYDKIMCSLPDRSGNTTGDFRPLYDANDTNSTVFAATNATNATAKNWKVVYYQGGDIPATSGTYDCNGVNMSRYITLNVKQVEHIRFGLSADSANTPIKIVSGAWDTTITAGTNGTGFIYCPSNDTIMTIYGDVKEFYCNDNNTKITGIDASNNVALCTLYCYGNQLTSLDLSDCSALRYLDCNNNQLTSLDVSKNTALTELECYSNQLTSLDLSDCSALRYLDCNNNQLTSLDVSACTALTRLFCPNNQLTSLDVSGCTVLTNLSCFDNQLTSLDVSGCSALTRLVCYGNPFTTEEYDKIMCSLPDRSGTLSVNFYPLYDANDTNSTVFAATNATNATAKNWKVVYYQGGDIPATSGTYDCNGVNMSRYITLNVKQVEHIRFGLSADSANTPIKIVSGAWDTTITAGTNGTGFIYYPSNDTIMTIYGDVKEFYCNDNNTKITGIDASNNVALCTLYCYGIQLTSLDVSKNTALYTLYCNENQLTSLDVSGCTALTYLRCEKNQLTSLDVSKNTALTELECYSNQLTSLDLSDCSALRYLYCDNNQLTSLDVSKNTALTLLNCGSNQLTSLDVSKNTALTELSCGINQLTSLDVSNNTALTTLRCNTNQLTSLDVSKNTALKYFYCYGNSFTTAGYDSLMCSLPSVTSGTGYFRPLYNSSDTNATLFAATNATNATAKNWKVEYYLGGTIPATSGTYDCRLNMSRYITLDVTKDSSISIRLATDSANTPIRIVSGDSVYDFTTTSTSVTNVEAYFAGDAIMTIYGDVKEFYCNDNNTNITGIDASNNTALTLLSCSNNQLTSLDVSNNTALTELFCYGNQFTTGGYDSLMCLLIDRNGANYGYFYPLYDANDANYNLFKASNATNAMAKNWNVYYGFSGIIPATTGNYDCNGGGEDPEDPTNVTEIKLSNIELYPNPTNSILNIKNATDNVQIFDITGREIMHVENKGEALLQINVSNLSKGMYFVKIGNYTTKFVKE